jgi:LuxR family maltose regulon positive regulatory protein
MATQPPVGAQERPLLRTKLYIPPLRREHVPRPRLIERLNEGMHRKLTLLSASAGFGKTTLLGEWVAAQERREPKVRIAWLSLDEGDNDPTNREIGERLTLALDTVKGHNRRIYRKLEVQRRTEAVARARELGLLRD